MKKDMNKNKGKVEVIAAVVITKETVSNLKEITVEEVKRVTTQNAKRIFNF